MDNVVLVNGYDRKKVPERLAFRRMTREEIISADHSTIWVQTLDGKARQVKVTSVKVWKTDPTRLEVGLKYGMYEFATFSAAEALERLLVRLD